MYQLGKHSFDTQEEYDKASQEVQTIQSIIKKHNIDDVQVQKRILDFNADGKLALNTAPGIEFLNRIKSAYEQNLKEAKIAVITPSDSSENETALTILGVTSVIIFISSLIGGSLLTIAWVLIALCALILGLINILLINKKARVVDDFFLAVLPKDELKDYKKKHPALIKNQPLGSMMQNVANKLKPLLYFAIIIFYHYTVSVLGSYASLKPSHLPISLVISIAIFILLCLVMITSLRLPVGSALKLVVSTPILLVAFLIKPVNKVSLLYTRVDGCLSIKDYDINYSISENADSTDEKREAVLTVYKDKENGRYSIRPIQPPKPPAKRFNRLARILFTLGLIIVMVTALLLTNLMINSVNSPKAEALANVNVTNVIPVK